jgi:hypothetical protein
MHETEKQLTLHTHKPSTRFPRSIKGLGNIAGQRERKYDKFKNVVSEGKE